MDRFINDQAIGLLQAMSGNLSLLPATQIAALLTLWLWRRLKYRAVPSVGECASLIGGLLALYLAGTAMVVLTFTYPPRYEYLSQWQLKGAGLFTAVITLWHVCPGLRRLFVPEAPLGLPSAHRESVTAEQGRLQDLPIGSPKT